MPTVSDVLAALEQIAPSRYAFGFDKIGLQVGDAGARVDRAVVSLDRSLASVEHAREIGAQLLLSHHPLLFEPLKTVTTGTHVGRTVTALLQSNIAFIAAHTNWDSAKGGVNDELAARLELSEVVEFGYGNDVPQLKLTVFAPTEDADGIIDAASEAGAGQIGLYSRCAFTSSGQGTFRPGPGSNPTVGHEGLIKNTKELRIEMVLPAERRWAVEAAVRRNHSYEEPAIDFAQLVDRAEQPAGRMGTIAPATFRDFAADVQRRLGAPVYAWGDPDRRVRTIGVVGGAADSEWVAALNSGAEVFVTGEVRQHIAVEASECGICIVAAGHHATEHPGVEALAQRLRGVLPGVEWEVFNPAPGYAGRPL